mgnify:CR=1 FL=1
MFLTYVRRHGLTRALGALLNFILLIGVVVQLGGLAALGRTRQFYEGVALEGGFPASPLFGSWVVSALLHPISIWVFLVVGFVFLAKELLLSSLQKRLVLNGVALVTGAAVTIYVIYVLYFVPIQAAAT